MTTSVPPISLAGSPPTTTASYTPVACLALPAGVVRRWWWWSRRCGKGEGTANASTSLAWSVGYGRGGGCFYPSFRVAQKGVGWWSTYVRTRTPACTSVLLDVWRVRVYVCACTGVCVCATARHTPPLRASEIFSCIRASGERVTYRSLVIFGRRVMCQQRRITTRLLLLSHPHRSPSLHSLPPFPLRTL